MAAKGKWVTIQQADLAKALARITRVVEKKNTIPILGNVLLKISAMEGELLIRGTDLDIQVDIIVKVTASDDFATTVPAAMLSDMVRKLPPDVDITLEEAESGRHLNVKSGRLKIVLNALPEADFPNVVSGAEPPIRFKIDAGILHGLIKRVEFAISTEETRYYLNGIYTEMREEHGRKMLRMVATDGHRLAMVQADAPPGFANIGDKGIIIPRKTVGLIQRLMEEAIADKGRPDKAIAISLSDTKVKVESGQTVLTSKLIDGTFPPYDRVIPAPGNIAAVINRHTLAEAAERVTTIASDRGRAVKMSFDTGSLALEVSNPDAGTATDEMACTYTGPPLHVGFNSRYLADAMKVVEGENAIFDLKDSGSPALIRGDGLADHLVVLMPVRIPG